MLVDETPGEIIEALVLWGITVAYLLYFLVFLLVLWSDRPLTGRDEYGRIRVSRGVMR